MHPALMIALMAERERELARRTRNAWRRPEPGAVPAAPRRPRRAERLTSAVARGVARFS
ncbi:MAG TPA: hypothetical protein VN458_05690 [Solirubrobacterales bacterium]|nr:hypothetical protein [Solirubrobacterales bacterium]